MVRILDAERDLVDLRRCVGIDGEEIAGRITSVSFSRSANSVIGFAYVAPDNAQPGATFQIRADSGAMVKAVVAKTPFVQTKQGE